MNLPTDPPADSPPAEPEARLQALVEEYIERLRAGDEPDAYEWLAAEPHLAPDLAPRLEAAELLYRLARSHGAPPPAVAGHADMPERIGRYHLEGPLGAGASAVVYRAYDPQFDRRVALKVFRSDPGAGAEFAERFDRDARVAAQLRHPNIVPLHETGVAGAFRYIDMELVEGETLEQRLTRAGGPELDFREAAALAQKLAAALDYAHGRGIVHRDVKPSNVVLDAQGEPQLTDFGLARRLDGEASLTAHGQIIGSPAYMPPEQADGRAREADARSDVYSLGVVLYRLLTGRLPFPAGDSLNTLLAQVLHGAPPAPRALNPRVPRDLETVCLKCLEKRPADRFATAGELADELRRWLSHEPLRSRPPSRWERLRRWARRNPPAALFAGAAALLLLVAAGGLAYLAWVQELRNYEAEVRARLERENATLQGRVIAEAEQALIAAASQRIRVPTEGRRREAQALLRRAARLRRDATGRPPDEQASLEIRSLYALTLATPDLRLVERVSLPGVFLSVWPVAIHPAGDAVAVGTHLGPLCWTPGRPLRVPAGLDPKQPRPRLAYSPCGRWLAFAPADGRLELWDAAAWKRVRVLEPAGPAPALALHFDADSRRLRACWADGRVRAWSLADPGPPTATTVAPAPGEKLTAAAFTADAALLAVGTDAGAIRIHGDGGAPVRTFGARKSSVQALAWSPDGALLAAGTRDGNVRLWERGGAPGLRYPAFTTGAGQLLFSPDGRWLLAGERGAMRVWDVSTGELALTGSGSPFAFTADGRRLAAGELTGVSVSELLQPTCLRPLGRHAAQLESLSWARDSRHLAALDNGNEVRVWDVARGLAVDRLEVPPAQYWGQNAGLALDDDGRWLAYASGGEQVRALLRDVRAGRTYGPWPLPRGYDRLVYAGGRFLSVREEEVNGDGPTLEAVARELTAAGPSPPSRPPVRPRQPGERGFFISGLTPDGRSYYWAGPRSPAASQRFEVREVATGRRTFLAPIRGEGHFESAACLLTHDGQLLVTGVLHQIRLHYLQAARAPQDLDYVPLDIAPDGALAVHLARRARDSHITGLGLSPFPRGPTWLLFADPAYSRLGDRAAAFSPDGRYLAWAGPNGVLLLADLPALRRELESFQRAFAK